MPSILIIDDEDNYLELCRRYMPEHAFLPPARNYREAAAALRRHGSQIDLVLLDVHFNIPEQELLPHDRQGMLAKTGDESKLIERLRRSQGLYILDQIRQSHPDLPVIVMTSRDDLPLEADAERLRAQDYTYLLDDDYLDARALKLQIDGILARRERQIAAADEPFYWGSGAAMLGHWRPLFLRWQRGGKMVATCGGAFLGVAPVVGAIAAGVWILVFLLSRYASLASIAAALALPVVAVLLGEPWPVIVFGAAAGVAVIVLHRANIARLRAGQESRFRFRRFGARTTS